MGPRAQLALIDVLLKSRDHEAALKEIRRLAERLADHAYDLPSVARDILLRRAGELFAAGVLPGEIADRAGLVDGLRSRVVPEAVATLSAVGADRWHHVVLTSRTGTEVFGWKSLELDGRPHVFGYQLSRAWFLRALEDEAEALSARHRATILIGLGIDFGIHILCRYREERRLGNGVCLAMRNTLQQTGRGNLAGAVTTAIAFGAMMFTDFVGIVELGLSARTSP